MKICIPIIRQDGLNDTVAQHFGMRIPAENTEETNT